jgi:hypothetical protein
MDFRQQIETIKVEFEHISCSFQAQIVDFLSTKKRLQNNRRIWLQN